VRRLRSAGCRVLFRPAALRYNPATIYSHQSPYIKENGAAFHRFDAVWTPTTLVLEPGGKERYRLEGYLPRDEFAAQLTLGLARVSLMQKKWVEAQQLYEEVLKKYSKTVAAPEAVYWRGVCRTRATNDHTVFAEVVKTLKEQYPNSVWNKKAIPWAG